MSKLAGKTAVVTGGTHGMGLAIVKGLLDGGAEVVLTGRNEKTLEEARTELKGRAARVVRSDAASMADIAGLADLARDRLGRIDHVFVNHGIAEFAELAEVTEESWDRQFAINTKGSFFTMQRLAPLINDGGSVVFTTVVNDVVFPGLSAYSASKEAMRAFAHVLAVELLPRGIRVNWGATGPSTRSPRPRCSSPPTRRSRRTSSWRWTAGSRRGCPSATDGSPVRGRSGAP